MVGLSSSLAISILLSISESYFITLMQGGAYWRGAFKTNFSLSSRAFIGERRLLESERLLDHLRYSLSGDLSSYQVQVQKLLL